eukprot:5306109-Prymnesium_polylepis.1
MMAACFKQLAKLQSVSASTVAPTVSPGLAPPGLSIVFLCSSFSRSLHSVQGGATSPCVLVAFSVLAVG